jgi:heterodisulfide reductase subunit C
MNAIRAIANIAFLIQKHIEILYRWRFMEELIHNTFDWNFANKVHTLTGRNINLCYQCKKCTVGCPLTFEMDYYPSQIIYAARLGMKDLVHK